MLDRNVNISIHPSGSSPKDQAVSDLEAVYLKAIELRGFEISQLVQRNNFFMIFQGVLLAGILQAEGKVPEIPVIVSITGFFMSVAQYRMAAGAKYWQQRWETELEETEKSLEFAYLAAGRTWSRALFHRVDAKQKVRDGLKKHKDRLNIFTDPVVLDKPSVSRIPIYTGALLAMAWASTSLVFWLRLLST
ncbi:hypothetical protein H4W19_12680 [Pseudoxanthomonas mexicana]|uniref:DUF4231 domain-containing protein n=1 Tax=Pseudoxanthomonas mexicana TaxID=128785 RepID=A0ABX6R8K6_PSEMX|nr:hypothetical protein [Pseudoxanthomonas mexicana]MCR6625816.1 hypothetical protein [Pseudoxanthomonas sp.]QND79212.1 hypothetical protein H4W19_12680 [Pseudoxanthomonas mexicana]